MKREREASRRPMACDLRNVPFFFFAFHSCPFPSNYSPSIPSSSTHWVHACTYASSILSPPLLRSYLSILLSNLRSLFRPTKHGMDDGSSGGGWRRRWRWPTTPSPLLSTLFIHSSTSSSLLNHPPAFEATKGEERRGIAASAKSRLMKSQFNHFTIGRGTIEEEGERLVREGRFIWRGQCRPLLYRHT